MELVDGRVRLRSLCFGDKNQIARLANNIKIWNNLKDILPHPYTMEDAVKFIDTVRKQDRLLTFGIEYQNEISGVIGLIPGVDVYRKSSEIGYWIGEPYWGKGIATKALNLATEYGLEELKFERLHAGVFEGNGASMRVLEKCGFKLECISKNAIFKNNKLLDEYRYAKLKD